MKHYAGLGPSIRAVAGKSRNIPAGGLLTIWKVNARGSNGQSSHHLIRIGMSETGDRAPWLERLDEKILALESSTPETADNRRRLALEKKQRLQELLHRELAYSGIINEDISYSAHPLAIIALDPAQNASATRSHSQRPLP